MAVTLDDRCGYWILGCVIGFVLGYITRYLQTISNNVGQINDKISKKPKEGGFMRNPIASDILVVVVVVMTAYAAFASQRASNAIERQVAISDAATECNTLIIQNTIRALNERTEYSSQSAQSNADLIRSQREFLTILSKIPPPSDQEALVSLKTYLDNTDTFLELSEKTKTKARIFNYPERDDLEKCIERKVPNDD